MSQEYWSIIVDEICDRTGITLNSDQTTTVISILNRAQNDYREQHGHREADQAIRRSSDDKAREPLFQFIERQMAMLDNGPNFFDTLSYNQKAALAYLTEARKAFKV